MFKRSSALLILFIASFYSSAFAADVPAELPKPDDKAPTDGKVRVYILAGQSNMVGFGTLKGAKPCYPSIFLSADPKVKVGRMPVGPSALLRLDVYTSDKKDAEKGAIAKIFKGAYDPNTDYSKEKPAEETTFPFGTVSEQLPSIKGPHTVVVETFVEVPSAGTYEIHPGMDDSTYAVAVVDGKEVYRKNIGAEAFVTNVTIETGTRTPISITYMKPGSAAFWLKQINLKGKGDLTTLTQEGKYTWFVDDEGNWTKRNDVTYWEVRCTKQEKGEGGLLTTTSNGKFIGPEVPFGYVMGTYHEEPVLLIESSMGNRALKFDFRPPSSGKTEEEKANKYCGYEYNHMVKAVHNTLKNIADIVPDYKGQGYEIMGFGWFQGHKDGGSSKEEYEGHLVNLINDLRKEFKAPDMRAVVATVGFEGMDMGENYLGVHAAQMAVSDPKQHPEFAGTVASVDTRPFWRSKGESPTGTGYHYNHNAETYVLTGDAMGRAMVELLGGKAERLTIPPAPKQHPDIEKIYSDEVTGKYNKKGPHYKAEYIAEMGDALKPIVMEEMIPSFIENAFGPKGGVIKSVTIGPKPKKIGAGIDGDMDTLMSYYRVGGASEYLWKPFGPEMKNSEWNYYSFDPPEKQAPEKSNRYRKITFPKGMENWYASDFDPSKAGWKVGKAPFGRMGDKLEARRPRCSGPLCGCSETPSTFWEKEVLLMQQTFEMPPIKEGHAYRFILGGAGCDRSGEGFAIYVNGKLLTQVNGGFYRHTGIRGAYIYPDMRSEFKGGKVTISIINFLRYTHFNGKTTYFGPHPDYYAKPVPPNGHVSIWMQEAKLSPEILNAAAENKKE